jgi:hypothetical protein
MKRKRKQIENWSNERGGIKKIKREKEKDRKKCKEKEKSINKT